MKPMIKLLSRADMRNVNLKTRSEYDRQLALNNVRLLECGIWHAMVYPEHDGVGDIAEVRMNKCGKPVSQTAIREAIRKLFESNEWDIVRVREVDPWCVELIGPRFSGERITFMKIEDKWGEGEAGWMGV